MQPIRAFLALAAPALLLAACGTPDEEELVQDAEDVPAAAETSVTPVEDPAHFDDEIGRPAFEAAMRTQCGSTDVIGAECRATEDPTQFVCQYELVGDGDNEQREATIAREGEEWVLAEIPAHCTAE
jgi:hypothetical protein